jgi:DNA-binding response OmpR family regulator
MEAYPESRRRVLVVDEEPAMRTTLELRLTASGYEVFLAEDALAARRLLYEVQPHAMIVDAQMRWVSGMALAAELIAEPALPWVPVIFVSEPVEALLALVERVLASERSGRDSATSLQLYAR